MARRYIFTLSLSFHCRSNRREKEMEVEEAREYRYDVANTEPRGPKSCAEKMAIEFLARCSHLIRESL